MGEAAVGEQGESWQEKSVASLCELGNGGEGGVGTHSLGGPRPKGSTSLC